ncbi:MAG: rhodanese-like domain-containing protein [Planctomycetaceae bacterium]|nr:rhodanese-like domain-containing protein [Planctomycetaceae bacterium]
MTTATYGSINVQQLKELCERGEVEVIDVRTPVEFREVHCSYARNVPLDTIHPGTIMAGRDTNKPLYVICNSGNRSKKACEAFQSAGYTNIINVEGGTLAWVAAGLPVQRGKKAISLERQVRIAAGLLAFLGATLGVFVHPYWMGLSAFVGAGLMFAGITDTCGMGLLLAKMPWNQVKESCPASDSSNPGQSSGLCCGG